MFRPELKSHNGYQNHDVNYYNQQKYNSRRNQISPGYTNRTDMSAEYWCETCDRGFNTQYLLDNHKKQHQKCNIDGCQFIAHPKVITKHIQMQHATGLYSKISKLQDPEEIKKWREERKSKFPSKENIEKKKAFLKEKIERGEKMGIRNRNFPNDCDFRNKPNNHDTRDNNKRKFNSTRGQGNNRDNSRKMDSEQKSLKRKCMEFTCDSNYVRLLKPFEGIQHLLVDDNEEEQMITDIQIEDEEWVEDSTQIVEVCDPPNKVCEALSTLISNYESSEEEPESLSTTKAKCSKIVNSPKKNIRICKNEAVEHKNEGDLVGNIIVNLNAEIKSENESENDGPEEQKIIKQMDTPVNPEIQQKSKRTKNFHIARPINKIMYKKKIPSTLLQKLLSKEIKHERNVILQCTHYIVNNNYLNVINNVNQIKQ